MKNTAFFAILLFVGFLALPERPAARDFRPPDKVAQPVITPCGGQYGLNEPVTVAIRAEPGCSVIYTLNGQYPAPGRGIRVDNHLASFPLPPGDTTVLAIAVRTGLPPSSSAKAEFVRSGDG